MEAQGSEEMAKEPTVQNSEDAGKPEERPNKKTQKTTASSELVSGIISLNIAHPTTPAKLKELEEEIKQVPELKIVLIGGAIDEGTEIIVSADNPIPLVEILSSLPSVSEVSKKSKLTQLVLETEQS